MTGNRLVALDDFRRVAVAPETGENVIGDDLDVIVADDDRLDTPAERTELL